MSGNLAIMQVSRMLSDKSAMQHLELKQRVAIELAGFISKYVAGHLFELACAGRLQSDHEQAYCPCQHLQCQLLAN